MKTQVMDDVAAITPWLEQIPADGGEAEKTLLESFPFTIGRSESADLRIDSSRVSRTHAVIEPDGRGYRVRDNSSTNGTFVNGQRVEKTQLEDGDMLVIADIEFSFFSRDASAPQQTATMVMDHDSFSGSGRSAVIDLIRGVRRYQEMLTHRSIVNFYEPILDLSSEDLFGYEAVRAEEPRVGAASPQMLMATECRLTGRLHQLCRMVAVEEAGPILGSARLFLKLYAAEIGTKGLAELLGKLRS
ncbi:MAG: FHA domain-containing protein, partial [Pirellulales bacterium]